MTCANCGNDECKMQFTETELNPPGNKPRVRDRTRAQCPRCMWCLCDLRGTCPGCGLLSGQRIVWLIEKWKREGSWVEPMPAERTEVERWTRELQPKYKAHHMAHVAMEVIEHAERTESEPIEP